MNFQILQECQDQFLKKLILLILLIDQLILLKCHQKIKLILIQMQKKLMINGDARTIK